MKEESNSPAITPGPVVEEPGSLVDAAPELFGLERRDDRTLRWTLTAAVVFHVILLLAVFPDLRKPRAVAPGKADKAYVVQTMRFKPPAPRRQEKVPKPKAKKIPIPDPTPDDPEPIEVAELEVPDLDVPSFDDVVFGIPDAPPGTATGSLGDAFQIGGDVRPPEKLFAPRPKYSEEARKARLQGAVILQAVIDALGQVTDVKVLKGLSLGLTESAIATVREWQFKPATRNGEAVPVYFNLVVTFSVQ